MQKANVNCSVLKNYFDFLLRQGAVEEKYVKRNKISYAITDRGLYLIKCFKELDQVIPTMKINTAQAESILQDKKRNPFNQSKEGTYLE
jgi:hypothetical protein